MNYHGPLGCGDPTYWMEGLYRGLAPQTVAVFFEI
jgi:hypothetical protein